MVAQRQSAYSNCDDSTGAVFGQSCGHAHFCAETRDIPDDKWKLWIWDHDNERLVCKRALFARRALLHCFRHGAWKVPRQLIENIDELVLGGASWLRQVHLRICDARESACRKAQHDAQRHVFGVTGSRIFLAHRVEKSCIAYIYESVIRASHLASRWCWTVSRRAWIVELSYARNRVIHIATLERTSRVLSSEREKGHVEREVVARQKATEFTL